MFVMLPFFGTFSCQYETYNITKVMDCGEKRAFKSYGNQNDFLFSSELEVYV